MPLLIAAAAGAVLGAGTTYVVSDTVKDAAKLSILAVAGFYIYKKVK